MVPFIQIGFTHDVLERFEYPLVSSLMRLSYFMSVLSAVTDPLIYFAISKDLRIGVKKLFGRSAKFSWEYQN